MTDAIHDGNIQCNLLKIFKNIFFKHSNHRKVNCVAYFVILRREPIKWAHCNYHRSMNRLLLMKTSAYRLNLIFPQIITLQAIPKGVSSKK
jgi:hypothetical protein